MRKLLTIVLLLTCMTACSDNRPVANLPSTSPSPSIISSHPKVHPKLLKPGKPGAYCAAYKVGKSFVHEGITYTCKGPKPYRWRQ
jgi:hypothetical protein